MKKLLVPVDFSEVSGFATQFAIELAEKYNAEITLLNSIHFEYFTDYQFASFSTAQHLMEDVKDAMVEKMEQFRNKFETSCKLQTRISETSLITSVKDMIREEGYDLVVLGTNGCSGLEEALIGSNTERVVRNANCPVIAVPVKASIDSIHKILIPIDIREVKESFLNEIAALQTLFNAHLEFFWVKTPHNIEHEDTVNQEFSALVKAHGIADFDFSIVKNVLPSDGILYHAYDTNADMIAMATHARRGIAHWLSGSLTEDTVNHIKIPVWSFKLDKAEKQLTIESVKV